MNARFQSVGLTAIADTLTRISFSPTVGIGRSSTLMVASAWTMAARWVFGISKLDISVVCWKTPGGLLYIPSRLNTSRIAGTPSVVVSANLLRSGRRFRAKSRQSHVSLSQTRQSGWGPASYSGVRGGSCVHFSGLPMMRVLSHLVR